MPGSYQADSDDEADDFWSASSLASTAADVVFQHGRRFPNRAVRHFPQDELAKQNEQALHDLCLRIYDDRLFTAPIQGSPANVLEVRCGALGLWSKTMADLWPEARVTGTDIRLTPDTDPEGRENLEFIEHSFANDIWVLDEVTQLYGQFDLIFVRSIFASSMDQPTFYKNCFEHTAPGGYIEQQELVPFCQCNDGTGRKDSLVSRLCELIPSLEQVLAVSFNPAPNIARLMEEAGFVDVRQELKEAPWSPWPPPNTKDHEIGRAFQHFYETGVHGWLLQPLINHHNMTHEQVNDLTNAAIIELGSNEQHWFSPAFVNPPHFRNCWLTQYQRYRHW